MPSAFGIGSSVPRLEDGRLLRGKGRFTDDLNFSHAAFGFVVRSPHAHANIGAIDTSTVETMPGVLAVFTGRDVEREKIGPIPCLAFPNTRTPVWRPTWPVLATDQVKFVGQSVAFIVAESIA